MKKKIIMLILVVSLVTTLFLPVSYAATTATTGTCGDNLTWNLTPDGILTISGTGPMYDYNFMGNVGIWVDDARVTNLVIDKGVTSIGNYAFNDIPNLVKVTIPDTVVSIGNSAFESCAQITELVIPDSVTTLGMDVLKGCENLTSIKLSNNITKIPIGMFRWCYKLSSIDIPANVTIIEGDSFVECKALSTVNMPYGLKEIHANAFMLCNNLKSLFIPKTVDVMESDIFNMSGLRKLYVEEGSPVGVNYATEYGFEYAVISLIKDLKLVERFNDKTILSYTEPENFTGTKEIYSFVNNSWQKITGVFEPGLVTINDPAYNMFKLASVYDKEPFYSNIVDARYSQCELLNDLSETLNEFTESYTVNPSVSPKATYEIYKGSEKLLSNNLPIVIGNNNFKIKVISEDEKNFNEYSFNIYLKSNKCELLNEKELSFTLDSYVESYKVTPSISPKASYEIYYKDNLINNDIINLNYGTNDYIVKITAENGEYKNYNCSIYIKSNQCELLNKQELSFEVKSDVTKITINPKVSEKARYEVYKDSAKISNIDIPLIEGKNNFTIKVTAENEVDFKTYNISVNRQIAPKKPEISNSYVFGENVDLSKLITKYGDDIKEEARNAKTAAVLYSKAAGKYDECGMIYSRTNSNPTADSIDSVVTPALKIGKTGAFGIYYYSDFLGTYYVRPYAKLGETYEYGDVSTFTTVIINK